MISVIVPVYNVELYLEKCLDSILNQTYSDLEIIVIDDGSTDSCGEICDQKKRELVGRTAAIWWLFDLARSGQCFFCRPGDAFFKSPTNAVLPVRRLTCKEQDFL